MHAICYICGSNKISNVLPIVHDYITQEPFKILRCEDCGVCFTYPVPIDMDTYYPDKYRKYSPLIMQFLKYFYRVRVERWLTVISGPGSALEIGCGSGLMLDVLQKKGWEVMGIERTEIIANEARSIFGLNVIVSEIEQLSKELRFDLIILFNVLEHMHAPQSILKECADRLKPNSHLIISTQNFESWQSNFSRHLWLHLDPPRHLFHFTPKSIKRLLNTVGLEISKINFISFEHDPFGWIQSIINKITRTPNILSRYLMGLDKFNYNTALSMFLCLILIIPSTLLSITSWFRNKGALMEIIARPSNANDTKKKFNH